MPCIHYIISFIHDVSCMGGLRQRTYDADGALESTAQLAAERGFVLGTHVIRKVDKAKGKIKEIRGDDVILWVESEDITGTCKVSLKAFLDGEWKIQKKPAERIIVDHGGFKDAIVSPILKVVELRGRIASALMSAGKKAEKCMEGLRLHIKPLRAVSTLKAYKTGKIMIPACSQKIETRSVPGAVCMGMHDGVTIYLHSNYAAPQPSKEGTLSPFWMVGKTHEESEANCKLEPEFGAGDPNPHLKVPVLVNTRDLEAGEILLVYEPKAVKRAPEELVIEATAPTRKRGKTAA